MGKEWIGSLFYIMFVYEFFVDYVLYLVSEIGFFKILERVYYF